MKTKSLPLNHVLSTERVRILTLSLIMALFAIVSVKAQTNTVVDIIVDSENHNTLETAVLAAGLQTTLSGAGPFTVFAPTDDAFAALGQETIDALLADPHGALTSVLQYHVAAGEVMAGNLTDGQIVVMSEGTDAFVSLFNQMAYINQAEITMTDIEADNGVVHVIDAVITQPSSIVDIVVNSPRHETLEAAVVAAELAGALSAPGTFTLFAPTDDAFAALGDAVGELLLDPTGELAEILKYHVVGATALSGSLSDGDTFTTLEGSDITVTINNDGVFINDAKVVFADYEAPNGVVHVIDAVITPPTTVVDIIVESDVHESLEAAVIAADLAGALSGDGPFTVFAPTDDAFAALGQETIDALFADATGALAEILKYHVVSGKVMAGDLSDGQIVEMFEGTDAFVSLFNQMAYINQAEITMTDIEADNGVVHVIDAVITQPTSIVDIVVNSPRHQTLEAAVVAAELAGALSAPGTFTLFAPTDDAFAALGDAVSDLLVDPTGYLAEILKYHAVGATAFSGDLADGDMFTTLKGYDIDVTINNDGVFINDAKVIIADYEAPNGVVHIIDAVMLPPADVQISDNQEYGSIMTDANGNSLYFFTRDADGSSLCVDGCLDNWPVFYQPSAAAGAGLDAADFGTIDRGDGVMQTTYKGWPLYYFVNDNAAGETNGEGVIGKWFLAKPDYSIMIVDNQLVGNDGENYTGDYTVGEEVIQYFTDAEGNTLYTWINDNYNKNNFTAEDFANNGAWPVYEEDGMIFPSTLDSSAFATIDVYGRTQLTYKGWPLYYFGQDAARGETKGVSVPSPGVWPVATADMMQASYATVVDIVVNSDVHTILETAVIQAELADDLSADGPFTVFAPTDDAFTALGQETIDALLADPTGELAQILLYHVVPGKAMSGDLSDGQVITTLNGDSITVSIVENEVFIDDAKVIVANIEAENGVVHVIDAVITPTSTVVDIIVGSDVHESLEAAVIAADLAGALSGDGPFTVFAPTDDAFAALGQETIDALFADATGALAEILKYHVVSGKVMAGDLSDGQIVEMFEGTDAFVSLFNQMAYINQAEITMTDIEADNGVVHVIDAVITQPTSIVDIVVNSPRHETLEAAVIAAELAGALSAPGTFTLFAPTDDAFAALGQETIDALLADPTGQLAEILKYHVVGATALSGSLSDGDTFTTLEGSDITVTINNDGVFINDAKVVFADYEAPNGVVHVIDAVITPPVETNTVVDIILNSDVHESLEAAVIAADLAGALSGDGPFTVFAPTDDAFAALGQETIDALFADTTGLLSSILQYHVVSGKVMAGDLSDGQIVEMFEGTDAFVSLFNQMAYINQAEITMTDIEADNGVVHVIDAVITQPTSIVDIVVNSPRHETLEAAVVAAQLAGALSAEGSFTLFAPTDDAFAALGQEVLDVLLADPTGQLAEILKYHVVGATALSGSLSDGDTFTTLEGSDITVTINNDGVFIEDAKVIFTDYEAPNGVVHVIDAVIQPEATNIEEEVSIFNNTVVYPNPATDRINFRFEMSNTSEVSIEVYDMVGQKVSQRNLGVLPTGAHDYVMGTEAMENGIYIIIVNSGNSAFANKVRVVR